MDDLAPTMEEVQTLISGRSMPPYRNTCMPSLTVPIVTGTKYLLSFSSLTQALSNVLSVSLGLGTSTSSMSSIGLFSSTPVVTNPSTQSSGSNTIFQAFPWNGGHILPPVPIFGTGFSQNLGSVSGFNPVPGPHAQTGGFSSSMVFFSSTIFSLFATGGNGTAPPVGSSTGS